MLGRIADRIKFAKAWFLFNCFKRKVLIVFLLFLFAWTSNVCLLQMLRLFLLIFLSYFLWFDFNHLRLLALYWIWLTILNPLLLYFEGFKYVITNFFIDLLDLNWYLIKLSLLFILRFIVHYLLRIRFFDLFKSLGLFILNFISIYLSYFFSVLGHLYCLQFQLLDLVYVKLVHSLKMFGL